MTAAARKLREQSKNLARTCLQKADAVAARISEGELGVAIRHDIETLRQAAEFLQDSVSDAGVYVDQDYTDDELGMLAADLDTRVGALEERLAGGRPH